MPPGNTGIWTLVNPGKAVTLAYFKAMFDLEMLAAFAVTALLVAWTVNVIVGMLNGENPRNTGSLWADIFLRLFMVLEFGFIGRVLNYCGFVGWPRKLVLFVALLCVLLFLARACNAPRVGHILPHRTETL